LTITAATLYLNGTVSLSCTDVGNGATTYAWTLPNGLTGSSNTNTITVTGATAGTYAANTISVKATNACGNTTATGSGGAITVRDYPDPNCSSTNYMTGSGGTYYYCGFKGPAGCVPVANRPGPGTYYQNFGYTGGNIFLNTGSLYRSASNGWGVCEGGIDCLSFKNPTTEDGNSMWQCFLRK
jgi:hypothetical protein